MDKHFTITIGREYGSGGRYIGKRLSEVFSIGYYDKEIITEAAAKSGLCASYFEKADERLSWTFSSALSYFFGHESALSGENIFRLQSAAIHDVASQGPCVIVGRCADYILRDDPGLISVFIHAGKDFRIANVMKYENLDEKKAREKMDKTDKYRASYYEFFTGRQWGAGSSYDITIDSSKTGLESTVEILKLYIEERLKTIQS